MTLLSVGGRVVVGRASFRRGGSVSGGLFTFRVPRQQLNHGVDSPDDQTGKAEKLQTHKNNYRQAPKKCGHIVLQLATKDNLFYTNFYAIFGLPGTFSIVSYRAYRLKIHQYHNNNYPHCKIPHMTFWLRIKKIIISISASQRSNGCKTW